MAVRTCRFCFSSVCMNLKGMTRWLRGCVAFALSLCVWTLTWSWNDGWRDMSLSLSLCVHEPWYGDTMVVKKVILVFVQCVWTLTSDTMAVKTCCFHNLSAWTNLKVMARWLWGHVAFAFTLCVWTLRWWHDGCEDMSLLLSLCVYEP